MSCLPQDGVIYVRQTAPLPAYPNRLTERLVHWAEVAPSRTYLAQRDAAGAWRRLSYVEVYASVRRLGQALLDAGLGPDRPLLILSGNDIEHALLGLAAYHVGIPYAPDRAGLFDRSRTISENCARSSNCYGRASSSRPMGRTFAPAIRAVVARRTCRLIVTCNPLDGSHDTSFFRPRSHRRDGGCRAAAFSRVGPDTVAKYLFTSGTTGSPKGGHQFAAHALLEPGDGPSTPMRSCAMSRRSCSIGRPGIIQLPATKSSAWCSTTVARSISTRAARRRSGIAATARNICVDVSPTWYFNVPKGYDDLVPYSRARRGALRRAFFKPS